MKKIAFLTGGTPNLAGPAGVFFLSLKSMSPELFKNADVFFLTAGSIEQNRSCCRVHKDR